jgi:uncharacterized membrane protein YfcA
VGLAQHYKLGNVDVRMAGLLAVGTAVGSFTGSNLAGERRLIMKIEKL